MRWQIESNGVVRMYPTKSDPVQTGAYISLLRKRRDMTQFALASALQVSHQAVSKWETGSALPDVDILLALANLFEVNINNLLLGRDERFDPLVDDRILYSETIANVIKTKRDMALLLEAYEEMEQEDIADCIQTLGITDTDILLKLCSRLSSASITQVIKTLGLAALVPFVADRMDKASLIDCIQTLGLNDVSVIRLIGNTTKD